MRVKKGIIFDKNKSSSASSHLHPFLLILHPSFFILYSIVHVSPLLNNLSKLPAPLVSTAAEI